MIVMNTMTIITSMIMTRKVCEGMVTSVGEQLFTMMDLAKDHNVSPSQTKIKTSLCCCRQKSNSLSLSFGMISFHCFFSLNINAIKKENFWPKLNQTFVLCLSPSKDEMKRWKRCSSTCFVFCAGSCFCLHSPSERSKDPWFVVARHYLSHSCIVLSKTIPFPSILPTSSSNILWSLLSFSSLSHILLPN